MSRKRSGNGSKAFYEEYWRYRQNKGYVYSEKSMPYRFFIVASLIGSGKQILDVGCGEGILAKLLETKGNRVTAFDVSERAVNLARRNGVEAFVCDIENEDPPLKDKFDVIILSEVLEHLVFPDKVLRKIKKYLKEAGYVILTFPNIAFFRYRFQLLKGRFPKQHLYEADEHLHYWSIPNFRQFLAKCGLEVTDLRAHYVFPFHTILSKFKPLVKVLKRFPNLFGYQILVRAVYTECT